MCSNCTECMQTCEALQKQKAAEGALEAAKAAADAEKAAHLSAQEATLSSELVALRAALSEATVAALASQVGPFLESMHSTLLGEHALEMLGEHAFNTAWRACIRHLGRRAQRWT
jgi:hypothetical protein